MFSFRTVFVDIFYILIFLVKICIHSLNRLQNIVLPTTLHPIISYLIWKHIIFSTNRYKNRCASYFIKSHLYSIQRAMRSSNLNTQLKIKNGQVAIARLVGITNVFNALKALVIKYNILPTHTLTRIHLFWIYCFLGGINSPKTSAKI